MRVPPPGIRVSVRHLDSDAVAHDLVGEVKDVGAEHLTVLPWDRGAQTVDLSRVVAWRRVPPKTVRPSSTPADMARLVARAWPGLEVERLGGWELRASGGYTRRANSALCEGDPGADVATAFERVGDFYRSRGLPPQVMLPTRPGERHPLGDALAARAWRGHGLTLVMTLDLRSAPAVEVLPELDLTWSSEPDPAWLAVFGRPHPLRLAVLTCANAEYLTMRRGGGEPIGIARLALTGQWVGVSGLWVTPSSRGQGLGARLLGAVSDRGLFHGARFAHLQVLCENTAAIRLYDRMGWQVHHEYRYLTRD